MTTADTVTAQGPTALLALAAHIHDHDLGMPLMITAPSMACPWFGVTTTSKTHRAWEDSGFVVTGGAFHPLVRSPNGDRWERVTVEGLLQPHGIRLHLTYTYDRHSALHAVSS